MTTPNFDTMLERLRERQTEPREEIVSYYCLGCEAQLTEADAENQRCTQCGLALTEDESRDEHLYDD